MKTKIVIVVASIFLLISCADPGGDPVFEGFSLAIFNKTNQTYDDAKLFIGGMKNNVFIPTDSILISPKIKTNSTYYYFGDENRWKPDLYKIREIPSDRCYFFIKLSDNRESLLGKYNQTEPFSIELPSDNVIGGNKGSIRIYIYNDRITADVDE